jgi:DNA-directed RNA polymerase subunit beta
MEQTSEDYESTRSISGYTGRTGQPTRGKKREGGQSIGNNDVYALLTYGVNDVLNELMTLRSDDTKRKRIVLNNLRKNGSSELPPKEEVGKSREIIDIIMKGLGLKIN